jgi:hypothetical protein
LGKIIKLDVSKIEYLNDKRKDPAAPHRHALDSPAPQMALRGQLKQRSAGAALLAYIGI